MTEYVVFVQLEGGNWEAYGPPVTARSTRSALTQAIKSTGGGTYVAVPARSWKPVTVKVETKTALRFS